jgi:hypothetical protein
MKPLIIIPAAGFGRRVGSPQSKEMLKRKNGQLMIDLAFEKAKEMDCSVHLITRKEKVDLISYTEEQFQKGLKGQIQIVNPTKEWPDSILKSQNYWHEWNLLFLPDTDFQPRDILKQICLEIQTHQPDFAAASFVCDHAPTWGCFRQVGDGYEFCEKPKIAKTGIEAWGFLFFKKQFGENLFSHLLESSFDHQWKFFRCKGVTLQMDHFEDLTRKPL